MEKGQTAERPAAGGLRSLIAVLLGVGIALLPRVACPACWPAYAGLLGSLGLGFLIDTAYLLPLTVSFLGAAILALGYRAARQRGYGPFALGVVAAVLVVVGKFTLDSGPMTYGGVALLVLASFWNSWPKRAPSGGPCSNCDPQGPLLQIGIAQTRTTEEA